jgi:hypothetical protein
MPEPTTALLPRARRFAVGFGPLLALACVVVFAAGALAQGESPSAVPRGDPIADVRESPTGVAGQGAAAAAPRPADADATPVAAAQGSSAPPAAYDEELSQFFLLLLAILALRPIVALVSAILRRRRERTD